MSEPELEGAATPHKRRQRYSGKNPRRFDEKYKEHNPARYPEDLAKVLASGKTPAGTHRPIMVAEILEALRPKPGDLAVDCTLGYGGHAQELLARISPGGRLIGIETDPLEAPKTEERLRALGYTAEALSVHRSNYAALPAILAEQSAPGAHCILADLGLSSMQIDDPARGFSVKTAGPLDMRMNPRRGESASHFLRKTSATALATILSENGDEPNAVMLAAALAGRSFEGTAELAGAIRSELGGRKEEEMDLSVRRVFQAIRIAVNDEFGALDLFLRRLPECLLPGGRVAILTFHSGEDRRVKKSFEAGLRDGAYREISTEVIRAGSEERRANPRSIPAKLRWAERAE